MLDEIKELAIRYEGKVSGREIAALGILHMLIAAMVSPSAALLMRMVAMVSFIDVLPSGVKAEGEGKYE
jgi:hypothetical protein